MPRSSRGPAPSRAAPSRPQAPPPQQRAPAQQQQRSMSTAPAQQAPAQAPASQGSGLFGQMASTAAGVAVGSSIGHAIGGFFGGGSSAAPVEQPQQYQQPVDNYSQPGSMYNSNNNMNANSLSDQDINGPCAGDISQFTACMYRNMGDMNSCMQFSEQMKACIRASRENSGYSG